MKNKKGALLSRRSSNIFEVYRHLTDKCKIATLPREKFTQRINALEACAGATNVADNLAKLGPRRLPKVCKSESQGF